MNASQILALSSVDAREWARHTDDIELLNEVREAATADTAKPRRTLLAAIEFRLSALTRARELDEAEPARDDSAPSTVEPYSDEDFATLPADVQEAILASQGGPQSEEEYVASLEAVATCALAFVRALTSGDVALVASMIDDVRRNTYGRDALASALVAAHVEARPVTVARAPKAERASRELASPPKVDSTLAQKIVDVLSNGPATTPQIAKSVFGEASTPNRRAIRAYLRNIGAVETREGASVKWMV